MTDTNQAISFGELWSIQESLLQSYRSIFITVESAIIAVTTFLLSSYAPNIYVVAPIIFLGFILIPIWIGVCNARARAVAFLHWLIQRHESGEYISNPYSHFRQFQTNRMYKDINVVRNKDFISLSDSTTRKRMDLQLPIIFAVIWGLLSVITIIGVWK